MGAKRVIDRKSDMLAVGTALYSNFSFLSSFNFLPHGTQYNLTRYISIAVSIYKKNFEKYITEILIKAEDQNLFYHIGKKSTNLSQRRGYENCLKTTSMIIK